MKKITFTLLLVMLVTATFAQKNVHNITQAQARLIESEFSVLTAPVIGELGEISPKKMAISRMLRVKSFPTWMTTNAILSPTIVPKAASTSLSIRCFK